MSPRPVLRLYTTLQQFEELHERHARTRANSETLVVGRQSLINILMDHARMLEALRKSGRVDIEDGD